MMGIMGIDEKKGREMGKFYAGFDIGSFAVHGAVVGEGGRVVYKRGVFLTSAIRWVVFGFMAMSLRPSARST